MTTLAYVCADPGIPLRGTKGASVHFREMGAALQHHGFTLDAFVARQGHGDAAPFEATTTGGNRGTGKGAVAELLALAANADLLARLQSTKAQHDAVYERYSLFSLAGLAHAREREIPLLLEVNAPLWLEAARFRSLKHRHVAQAVFQELGQGASRLLAVSQVLADQLVAEGIDRDKIVVFPNGVRASSFLTGHASPSRPTTLRQGVPLVVFIGSLKPWHGIELLLEELEPSLARGRLALWLVGDGPLRTVAEDASRRHPDLVVAQGPVPHDRIPAILAAADVAVAPYPADAPPYFCPLKAIEAMAAGCPLVASDLPFVREVVGTAAELFVPGVPGSLADAIGRATRSPRSADLRQQGQERVRRHFTWQRRAEDVSRLLQGNAPDRQTVASS